MESGAEKLISGEIRSRDPRSRHRLRTDSICRIREKQRQYTQTRIEIGFPATQAAEFE